MIFNRTALIQAASCGHAEIVDFILRHSDIDISIKDIFNHIIFIVFRLKFFS